MYCPKCGAEFREGFDRCNECDVALAEEPPTENHDAADYVKVFETSQADVIPVIKSFLRGAEIPFQVRGESMMNLFPSDLLGPVMSQPAGQVLFLVPEDRAEEARELFEAQTIDAPELEPEDGGDTDAASE